MTRFAFNFLLFAIAFFMSGCSHSGETIVLRFVDESGQPVSGVQNRIYGDDFPKHVVLTSDRNGNCTLDFSAIKSKDKSFQTYTWHPDYVDLRCGFGPFGIMPTPKEYTFRLERGRCVGGLVVDHEGKPVAGAKVSVNFIAGEPDVHLQPHFAALSQEPITDKDGKWTATQIPSKKFYPLSLFVKSLGFAPLPEKIEEENDSFQKLLDKSYRTVLQPGINVSGKLVAKESHDFKHVVVRLHGPFHFKTKIDVSSNGEFQLTDLPPGEFTLQIIPENHAPMLFFKELTTEVRSIEIPLKPGSPIRFHVVDPEGNSVSGVEMRGCFLPSDAGPSAVTFLSDMKHAIKSTNEEGRTAWLNAPDTKINYAFYHNDYFITTIDDLLPRENEYVVTMYRKVNIRGTVVDADTQELIPMYQAIVTGWTEAKEGDDDESQWMGIGMVWPAVVNSKTYEITPMFFRDRCRVEIHAEGYEEAKSEEFSLKDGNQTFDFKLKKKESEKE